jgi:Skp family chaperone for outer membrane proteins
MNRYFFGTILLAAIIIASISSQTAFAEDTLKIAIVDVEKVLEGYEKWDQYSKELKQLEKEIKDKKTEVEAEIQDKLRSLELLMKREDKQRQLQQIEAFSQAESQKLQPKVTEFKQKRDSNLKECLGDIKKAITIVGKEQNCDAVFTNELCFYAKHDISDFVIKKVNQLNNEQKTKKDEK